jgi:hypothetical protein
MKIRRSNGSAHLSGGFVSHRRTPSQQAKSEGVASVPSPAGVASFISRLSLRRSRSDVPSHGGASRPRAVIPVAADELRHFGQKMTGWQET